MPITLGCPSCAKRFRARDESAGKKVKCPYCQAAVQVPSAEESASAGAPTAPIPTSDASSRPVPPPPPAASRASTTPGPAAVASPDDWGALPTGPAPAPPSPPPPPEPAPQDSEPLPPPPKPQSTRGKERPKATASEKPKPKPAKAGDQTPEQIAAAGWRSVYRGLFWVQFALVWLGLLGFVGFGKAIAARTGNELPKGDGKDWVVIEGYINSGVNSVTLNKTDLLNLAAYGIPVLFAGVLIVFGRLIASSAPRSSGARGLFSMSALFGLVGFGAMLAWFIFSRLLMEDESQYTWVGFILLLPLAEFWFLNALTASGVALKRPKAARAVGAVGFMFALAAFVGALGWDLYVRNWRPKPVDDDIKMYEQAALMLGWLLLIGVYSRAVRGVRVAAREYLDTVEEG